MKCKYLRMMREDEAEEVKMKKARVVMIDARQVGRHKINGDKRKK